MPSISRSVPNSRPTRRRYRSDGRNRLGEAVGLGLELGMLAAGDELERVELGGEMAAGPIGADQHAGAERVARRGQRCSSLKQAARLAGAPGLRSVGPRTARAPRRECRPRFVEAGEESAPFRIERSGVLLVAGVKLSEVGGVGALQERRVEKHLVQFVSGHRSTLPVVDGYRPAGQRRRALGARLTLHVIFAQGSFQGRRAACHHNSGLAALPRFCAWRRPCRLR